MQVALRSLHPTLEDGEVRHALATLLLDDEWQDFPWAARWRGEFATGLRAFLDEREEDWDEMTPAAQDCLRILFTRAGRPVPGTVDLNSDLSMRLLEAGERLDSPPVAIANPGQGSSSRRAPTAPAGSATPRPQPRPRPRLQLMKAALPPSSSDESPAPVSRSKTSLGKQKARAAQPQNPEKARRDRERREKWRRASPSDRILMPAVSTSFSADFHR